MLITPEVVPLPATQPKTVTLIEILRFCLSVSFECLERLATRTLTNTLSLSYLSEQTTTQKLLDQYSV